MRIHLAVLLGFAGLLSLVKAQGQQTAISALLVKNSGAGSVRTTAGPANFATFPNVLLYTQENAPVHFYDDLVKGRTALINFFYTNCKERCPRSTANLAKLQDEFGDHLGRDVVMLSITVDTQHDNPETLKHYAAMFKAKPGWYF